MQKNDELQVTWNVKLDLLVLRYMAQKVHALLLNSEASRALPSVCYAEEHRGRIHRIVIYGQQEFLLKEGLLFVGFISGIQEYVSLATMQEIHRVDKVFIAELASNAGLLSYSSLELNKGHWYNLVLLSDQAAKAFFKESSTHRYAAYQLSPQYYAWIRLHNGIMPGGLEGNAVVVQSTKYYTFSEIGQRAVMYERSRDR